MFRDLEPRDYFYPNRAFSFSPFARRPGLWNPRNWPKGNKDLDECIRLSQGEGYVDPYLQFAVYLIRTEPRITDGSTLRLIAAAHIVRNVAWKANSNLEEVINLAEELMKPGNVLVVREAGVGALKNAASHEGQHIAKAIELAVTDWPEVSGRITYDCVRTLLYAAEHSKNLLQTEKVRQFLERECQDGNLTIAGDANKALVKIFS